MQLGDEHMSITLFEQQPVRRAWHDGRWFYSVIDAVAILTQNTNPRRYWSDLKRHLHDNERFIRIYAQCVQIGLVANDGKMRNTDCVDVHALYQIVTLLPALYRREHKGNGSTSGKSGIYAIINTVTNERYIGSSADLPSRFGKHRSDLKRNKHHSPLLQEAWNHFGEDAFLFVVLETVTESVELEQVEQLYLEAEHPAYNIAPTANNAHTLKPVEEAKAHRLLTFLQAQSGITSDGPLTHPIHIAINAGIVLPGPNYHMLAQAEMAGIIKWDTLQTYVARQQESVRGEA